MRATRNSTLPAVAQLFCPGLLAVQGVTPALRTFNTLIIACNMCNQPREALAGNVVRSTAAAATVAVSAAAAAAGHSAVYRSSMATVSNSSGNRAGLQLECMRPGVQLCGRPAPSGLQSGGLRSQLSGNR
jgi:hypothetical protein